ncbi:hypothetical protein BOTNAR_0183g00180 [Botryotinia narcissicola]|uniref:Uncharacterized protein n=1 Tax=Botryotinia narcissicola TaxID=278944 RepID=A0A4Z1I9P7_9HELO|nr:hypothetical protein BOTNAR_0183g00180 [Botryotinia narcissicola]
MLIALKVLVEKCLATSTQTFLSQTLRIEWQRGMLKVIVNDHETFAEEMWSMLGILQSINMKYTQPDDAMFQQIRRAW